MLARKDEKEQWEQVINKNFIKASRQIARENPGLHFDSKSHLYDVLVEKSNEFNAIDWKKIKQMKIDKGEIIARLEVKELTQDGKIHIGGGDLKDDK